MEYNYQVYMFKQRSLETEIGAVVSRWANLELQILLLGAWGLATTAKQAAHIYAPFKTFALTLEFTQAVCRPRMADARYFNSLVDLIRETSGDRNFIAHTAIVAHGEGDPNETDWATSRPMIGPSIASLLTSSADKRDPMDEFEVREVATDINFLIDELMGFSKMLEDQPQSWPQKYLEPVQPRRLRLSARRGSGGKTQ